MKFNKLEIGIYLLTLFFLFSIFILDVDNYNIGLKAFFLLGTFGSSLLSLNCIALHFREDDIVQDKGVIKE